MKIYAENAWTGPGRFVQGLLLELTSGRIERSNVLEPGLAPPADAKQVAWLVPGFINAHCHLEYTALAGRLPRGPIPFGEWMQAIMASGRQVNPEERQAAMQRGARQLIQGGCTGVIDSTTDGCSGPVLEQAGLHVVLAHEVLGLTKDRARDFLDRALQAFRATGGVTGAHILNPHAPYSVGPWLRGELLRLGHSIPQAWHLAETADEAELFTSGGGSIADTLRAFGLPLPFDQVPGCTPWQFLQREGLLQFCDLAFHGDTLSDDEATYFRAPRALVHCPGTRRWFQRPAVPLSRWLKLGVNVCLGTDSLASSDSLSMLDMVRWTLEDNPDLSPDQALQMACVNPRQLSFWPDMKTGLVAGALADLVVLQNASATDWRNVLTSPNTVVGETLLHRGQASVT